MKLQIEENVLTKVEFEQDEKLFTIILPAGIIEIGVGALCGCESLQSIVLPSSLRSIRERAFAFCKNIKRINIPEGVTRICSGAFTHSGLTSVNFPHTLRQIGAKAFANTDLVEIAIPDSVCEIGSGAFSWCKRLRSVRIGAGIETIEEKVFSACFSLQSIQLSEHVRHIDETAFQGCALELVFWVKTGTPAWDYAVQHRFQVQCSAEPDAGSRTGDAQAHDPSIPYASAVAAMNQAHSEEAFRDAEMQFRALGPYANAAEFAQACHERAEALRQERVYGQALEAYEAGRAAEDHAEKKRRLETAGQLFETIPEWRDAAEKAKECRSIIDECDKPDRISDTMLVWSEAEEANDDPSPLGGREERERSRDIENRHTVTERKRSGKAEKAKAHSRKKDKASKGSLGWLILAVLMICGMVALVVLKTPRDTGAPAGEYTAVLPYVTGVSPTGTARLLTLSPARISDPTKAPTSVPTAAPTPVPTDAPASVPAMPNRWYSRIYVHRNPTKMTYTVGEYMDLEGLELWGDVYDANGEFVYTNYSLRDSLPGLFEYSPNRFTEAGRQEVTFGCWCVGKSGVREWLTASVSVTVKEAETARPTPTFTPTPIPTPTPTPTPMPTPTLPNRWYSGIYVHRNPTKMTYTVGEYMDLEGLELWGDVYDANGEYVFTNYFMRDSLPGYFEYSPHQFTKAGKQRVTFMSWCVGKSGGREWLTASVSVTVKEAETARPTPRPTPVPTATPARRPSMASLDQYMQKLGYMRGERYIDGGLTCMWGGCWFNLGRADAKEYGSSRWPASGYNPIKVGGMDRSDAIAMFFNDDAAEHDEYISGSEYKVHTGSLTLYNVDQYDTLSFNAGALQEPKTFYGGPSTHGYIQVRVSAGNRTVSSGWLKYTQTTNLSIGISGASTICIEVSFAEGNGKSLNAAIYDVTFTKTY